jgi:hypothetical protein
MCSLRMLIPLHRGSTDAARGQAMARQGRESAVRSTGLIKRLGPGWHVPSRPLVDRTRQPPANGVEHCETDANRGCGRKRPGPQGIRVTAKGLAPPTESGSGSNVVRVISSPRHTPIQRFQAGHTIPSTVTATSPQPARPAPAGEAFCQFHHVPQTTFLKRLSYSPCCCRSCGRGSSCHFEP